MIFDSIERTVVDTGIAAQTVPDSESTLIIPDTNSMPDDIVSIELFNAGDNKAYMAYGRAADSDKNFNAFLFPGAALNVKTRMAVYCYSPGGTQIGITVLRRNKALTSAQ